MYAQLLNVMIFFPLVAALGCLLAPESRCRSIALSGALVTFAMSVMLAFGYFVADTQGMHILQVHLDRNDCSRTLQRLADKLSSRV